MSPLSEGINIIVVIHAFNKLSFYLYFVNSNLSTYTLMYENKSETMMGIKLSWE